MDYRQNIIDQVAAYAGESSRSVIEYGLALADQAHGSVMRTDGTPYMQHLLRVAEILASWQAPPEVVAAGLLHDLLKAGRSALPSLDPVREALGPRVVDIITAVNQLGGLGPTYPVELSDELINDADYVNALPWVALALNRSPLAAIIRIAARLERLRSLTRLASERQRKYAIATLSTFVPLANRLGMWAAKRELEDHAFRLLYPEQFEETQARYPAEARSAAGRPLVHRIQQHLARRELSVQVDQEPVSNYFLYLNEVKRGSPISLQVSQAIRVLTADVATCWDVLRFIHELWQPMTGQVWDYITHPKSNGFRALCTRLSFESDVPLVVMIRGMQMQLVAEWGYTARWLDKSIPDELLPRMPKWHDPPPGKIAVFTPTGELKILPEGATPIDFAYGVHRDIGHQCTGAIVNNEESPLDRPLRTGNVVEILTSGGGMVGPALSWLEKVKTARARKEIRRWLDSQRPDDLARKGRELLAGKLREDGLVLDENQMTERLQALAAQMHYPSDRELLVAVGIGERNLVSISSQLQKPVRKTDGARLARPTVVSSAHYYLPRHLARCCRPLPPDEIVGYVTQANEFVIHRANCGRARRLKPLIPVEWGSDAGRQQWLGITVAALDRLGLLRDITAGLADIGANLVSFHADRLEDGTATIQIGVGIDGAEASTGALTPPERMLEVLRAVRDVRRVEPGSLGAPSHYAERSLLARHIGNPYTLKPVSGRSFYGRQEELQGLINNLRDVHSGEAVLLWGPRRIGKTSLLLQFQSTLAGDYLPVFVDLQGISGGSTVSFLQTVAANIDRLLRNPDLSAPGWKKMRRDPFHYFSGFVESFRRFEPRHLILVLDEFQILTGLREEQVTIGQIFNYFRSLIQESSGLSFVFSAGGNLDVLRQQVGAASLLNVTHDQKVGCLERQAARRLIVEPVERFTYAEDVVARLLALTDCHPYYLQMLCGELTGRAHTRDWQRIETRHLDDLIDTWLPEQGQQHFCHLWGSDSGIDRQAEQHNRLALAAVAHRAVEDGWADLSAIAGSGAARPAGEPGLWRVLQALTQMDTLESDGQTRFRFKADICARWMRANYSVPYLLKEIGL